MNSCISSTSVSCHYSHVFLKKHDRFQVPLDVMSEKVLSSIKAGNGVYRFHTIMVQWKRGSKDRETFNWGGKGGFKDDSASRTPGGVRRSSSDTTGSVHTPKVQVALFTDVMTT